jgi:hypothetical protein
MPARHVVLFNFKADADDPGDMKAITTRYHSLC